MSLTKSQTLLHNLFAIVVLMLVTISLIPACSTPPKKVAFSAEADPQHELEILMQDLTRARQNQVALLSPRFFEKSQDHYQKAQNALQKGKTRDEILSSVGMAKAYLNFANEHAEKVKPSARDILAARDEAIAAGAAQFHHRKFARADHFLLDAAFEAERKRSSLVADRRGDLQRNFLDLQIDALKEAHLKSVDESIELAKDNGARRLAPRTLALAESKLVAAENVIETDRNNNGAIAKASLEARQLANRLLDVTHVAKTRKVSETVALELITRENQRLNGKATTGSTQISESESLILQERAAREALESQKRNMKRENEKLLTENEELSRRNEINELYKWAQNQFTEDEAEVLRKGDLLIIRLQDMNYKPGQTELPESARPLLDKVKTVITRLGTEKVRIEGHTDSLGSKTANEELSQERAEKVAEFLLQDESLKETPVEAEGMGFDKPISSNASEEGRAQNRRVEIILTPGTAAASNVPTE